MNWNERIIAAHTAVTHAVSHYKKLKSNRYFVWQEDGAEDLIAEGEHSERVMFTGDTLFCRTVGRTDLPGGNWDMLVDSISRLAYMDGDYTVYTGHNRSTTLAVERERNRYMRKLFK